MGSGIREDKCQPCILIRITMFGFLGLVKTLVCRETSVVYVALKPVEGHHARRRLSGTRRQTWREMVGARCMAGCLQSQKLRLAEKLYESAIEGVQMAVAKRFYCIWFVEGAFICAASRSAIWIA